ncbi:hypothetical protein [Tetragenococcus solitarius]|uniref:Uncharacterized protein n=1 Tax=Tetragenococcus solitarius TaxID=71453 RepID=A0ABN3YAA3_9ENTE|nr:hypothetical protein [Tetragenococcus solitarius]
MTQEEFAKKLQELKDGNIAEVIVEQADFMEFRKAWLSFSDRSSFVGKAGLSGTIHYKYFPAEQEK